MLTIIERKSSHAEIPLDGWPDLRAQLWCCAQIDHPVWHKRIGHSAGEVFIEVGTDAAPARARRRPHGVDEGRPVLKAQNTELFARYNAKYDQRD